MAAGPVTAGTTHERRQSILAKVPYEQVVLPAIIVVLCVFFQLQNSNFFTTNNLINIARQSSFLAMIAVGQTFAIISGGIDLSVGSMLGMISVIGSLSMLRWGEFAGYPIFILVGIATGLFNGLMITRLGLPPFIATLATLTISQGVALTLSAAQPIVNLPGDFSEWGTGSWGPLPIPFVVAVVIFVVAHLVFTQTRLGRYIYAIGGNEESALLSGISVRSYKTAAYVISGFLAGICGLLLTSRSISGQPTLGWGEELNAIAAVVIGGTPITGGRGSIVNTVLGVMIIGILSNGLNLMNVSSFVQRIIIGAIIAVAVFADQLRVQRS